MKPRFRARAIVTRCRVHVGRCVLIVRARSLYAYRPA